MTSMACCALHKKWSWLLILLIINTLACSSSQGNARAKEGRNGDPGLKAVQVVFILFAKSAHKTK